MQGKSIADAIDAFLDCASIKKQVQKRLKEFKNEENETRKKKGKSGFHAEREKLKQKVDDFAAYETELFQKLSEEIESGHLISIGYREPIGASDFPVLIPLKFWPPEQISLETSSAKFLKANYSAVRISENPKGKIDFLAYDSEPPHAGRSTNAPVLIQAYEYLRDLGQIDYTKTFKSQLNKIRQAVFHLHPDIPDDRNLADKTIQKHLSSRFQNEKLAFKRKTLNQSIISKPLI